MNKKYLVILAGSPRGGEKTWHSLYRYVTHPLNADLAICCGNDISKSSSLYQNAKYKWLFKEYEDWIDYYKENKLFNAIDYLKKGIKTGLFNSGSVHYAIKDIILKNHIDTIKKYDYIIYSRFDQFYIDYHPELNQEDIFIPEGQDYFGIRDRHAAFPAKYADKILDICDFINSKESIQNIPDYLNCETSYLDHLQYIDLHRKVKRMKRFQFTTAIEGDNTRWRIAIYRLWFSNKIKLKYPDEFFVSFQNRTVKHNFLINFYNHPILYLNYLFLRFRVYFSKYLPDKLKKFTTERILKEK